jgi:Protein of unknown function (DUF3617)
MSTQRVAALFVLCAAAIVMSVRADQPVNLAVDMGLWEITTHGQMSGAIPPQMEGRLQNMSPEQRKQIEAAMQGMMADSQREHVFRECMTPERWSRGFDSGYDTAQCKSTLMRNTRTEFEYSKVCAPQGEEEPGHTEKAHFHLLDRHHVAGTVDVVQTGSGHPMTVHQSIEAKWLGSSCGDVKDVERVR